MEDVNDALREEESCEQALLRRRLFATVMEDGDDVLEHINKLRTLAEHLDVVGALVSDKDFFIKLLSSLND